MQPLIDGANAFNIAMESSPDEMKGDNYLRFAAAVSAAYGGSRICTEWEARARQSALRAIATVLENANGQGLSLDRLVTADTRAVAGVIAEYNATHAQ